MRFALPPRRFVLPVAGLVCLILASGQATAQSQIAWQNDLQNAHASATSQDKPLLLHFRSDKCVWCDRLEAGAFQSPSVVSAINQQFVPVSVNANQSPELARMFQVSKFPTDVIVMPSGQTLSHSVSPQEPEKYVAMLSAGLQSRPAPTSTPATTSIAAQTPPENRPVASTVAAVQVPASPVVNRGMGTNAVSPRSTTNPYATVAGPVAGGATAQLAGAKTDAMTLGMPGQLESPTSSESMASPAAMESTPKLAMEGFCSVTVIDDGRWAEGNPKFGVIHLGKLFLFESEEKMARFLADPKPYTPVLNEIDVIRFFEERRIVPGKRQFGVQDPIHGRMFFFADEAAMNHFDKEYQRYVEAAIEVMDQAVQEANPNAS